MKMDQAYVVFFQLILDEVAIAQHRNRKLDRGIYGRMFRKFQSIAREDVFDPAYFPMFIDDALIYLDVSAAIHCDDLGEYSDVNLKRTEMAYQAVEQKTPFFYTDRYVSLVSEDIDLSYVISVFNRFEPDMQIEGDDLLHVDFVPYGTTLREATRIH